jgi:carboxyl-terminal processing protease
MTKSSLFAIGGFAMGIAAAPLAVVVTSFAAPSNSDIALIVGVIDLVQRGYVHAIGPDQLTKDALKGMLSRLDPHSDYMDEKEFRQTRADISGKFGGLGIEISEQDGIPKVIAPIDDTPAAKAGLQPGDLIVAVDGKDTQGLTIEEVVDVLRGAPGTTVKLGISRGAETPFEVTLTRSIIRVQSVKSKLQSNDVGYVRLTQFGEDTASGLATALGKLKSKAGGHLKGLVIDLRNDPGGLLSSAVDVASQFLDRGTVVAIRGRLPRQTQVFQVHGKGDTVRGTPVVVLINGASASASEIVAGALQDYHRATVMGTQSFGKGSVQSIIPLAGHGAVRLTTALYFTPSGRSIQAEGITPDIVVEASKDEQVEGALITRESALRGAFSRRPAAGKPKPESADTETAGGSQAAYSPPIKADLIGTPTDAQLNAAYSHLAQQR